MDFPDRPLLPEEKHRRLEARTAAQGGMLAGRAGSPAAANPYPETSPLAEAWRSGWDRAQTDKQTIARLLRPGQTLPVPAPMTDEEGVRPVVDGFGLRGFEVTDRSGRRAALEFARPLTRPLPPPMTEEETTEATATEDPPPPVVEADPSPGDV